MCGKDTAACIVPVSRPPSLTGTGPGSPWSAGPRNHTKLFECSWMFQGTQSDPSLSPTDIVNDRFHSPQHVSSKSLSPEPSLPQGGHVSPLNVLGLSTLTLRPRPHSQGLVADHPGGGSSSQGLALFSKAGLGLGMWPRKCVRVS